MFVDRWPLIVDRAASRGAAVDGARFVDGERWTGAVDSGRLTVDEALFREHVACASWPEFVGRWPLTVDRSASVDGGWWTVDEALPRESRVQRWRNTASTTVNGQRSTKSAGEAQTTHSRNRASSTVNRPPSTTRHEAQAAHSRSNVRRPPGERGFTLAGVLVICTVLMVFVAYTVPRQWSTIIKRGREKQTIFVMKQYARSIKAFQTKNGNALPTSLDQLKKARMPRLIRGVNGEWEDPLTGKVDWLLVPPTAAPIPPQLRQGQQQGGLQQNPPLQKTPKDYVGPFVGVRPPVEGQSLLSLNGADRYEQWLYTVNELNTELNGLLTGVPQVPTTTR